jgi:hypothetical protein
MRRILALAVIATALLLSASAAQGQSTRSADNLTLYVNFDYAGNITVSLPSGTPVGAKSGSSPTVIPAGYYTVELSQPGCVDVPTFILQGPGVDLEDDLESGEIVTDSAGINLQPNATYTWRSGSINPPVYFTFQTNSQVIGTPPSSTNNATAPPLSKRKQSNTDIVGSDVGKGTVGTLAGGVSAAGKVSLALKGKSISVLKPGRYKLTIDDASRKLGFALKSSTHRTMTVTSASYVGTRSASIVLTAGTWSATSGSGAKKTFRVT